MGNRPVMSNTISTGIYPSLFSDELTSEELRRMKRETTLWRFYTGDQWRSAERKTDENRNTTNYCRSFVDKGVAFLMGKGFEIDTKEEARNVTKPLLDEVWEDNDKELLGLDLAQAGGVSGSAFAKVTLEEFDPEEYPEKSELYPDGRIRINVLPSYNVFPQWNPHDKDKMDKCIIMYPITERRERADGAVRKEKRLYKEVLTKDTIREYIDGELQNERENPINAIPVVRIKNFPKANSAYGVSDIEDIVPLQREMNYKTTDISDIINYHAAPVTIIKGAKARNLEKGSRKVWGGIPKDGDVYNLTMDSELNAALEYINLIKTSMFELANMPEDAFGKEMNVSNTSGVALEIKNQPLMEATRTKWKTYGKGIKDINKLIIKYGKYINHSALDLEAFEQLSAHEKYYSEVNFPNPLPKDELIQMQLITQKLKNMLMSRTDALAKMGVSNPEEKLEEIFRENKIAENLIFDADYEDFESFEKLAEALELNIGGQLRADEQVDSDVPNTPLTE